MKRGAAPWRSAPQGSPRRSFRFARVAKRWRVSLPAALCKASSRATVEGSRCASLKLTSTGSLDFARDDALQSAAGKETRQRFATRAKRKLLLGDPCGALRHGAAPLFIRQQKLCDFE